MTFIMPKGFCSLLVIFFMLGLLATATPYSQLELFAPHSEQDTTRQKKEKFDVARVIWEEILDNNEFVLAERNGHPVSIPLPIILYSPQRGLSLFLSSKFRQGRPSTKAIKWNTMK